MTGAIILLEAETELREAIAYYEGQCPGLGLDFEEVAQAAVETIEAHPLRCRQRNDGTRRLLLSRFPFLVVYMIRRDELWIVAFAHCKRRPGYWEQRNL